MIHVLLDLDEAVAKWVAERLDIEDFGYCRTMALVADDGEMLGGVIFNNWRHTNIEMTIATVSPRWCKRSVLATIFSYPFFQLKCKRVTAITEVMNQPVRAFLCRLGFQEEGTLRKWFLDGADGVIYGMLAEECRWITVEERMGRVAA